MSTTHNNRHASSHWLLGTLLNLAHLLLLIALAGGLILVVPASAQSTEALNIRTGSILGTAVDPRRHARNCLSDHRRGRGICGVEIVRYSRTRAGKDSDRRDTPHFGCAAGGYGDLFLKGGCCPTAQS